MGTTIDKDGREVKFYIRATKEDKKKYKIHCLKNDMTISDRLRRMMEMDMNNEIKFK